jgi:hypothetical protein
LYVNPPSGPNTEAWHTAAGQIRKNNDCRDAGTYPIHAQNAKR